MSDPKPLENVNQVEIPDNAKMAVGGVYALMRAASSPGESGAGTLFKGITSYGDALIIMGALEALWNARNTALWFFIVNIALGLCCFPMFLKWSYTDPGVRMGILIYGVFVFAAAPIIYAIFSPRILRGRIMPYKGHLVMHGSPTLDKVMTTKVGMMTIATALVPIHVWVIVNFAFHLGQHLFEKARGVEANDPVVAHFYPTPVPQVNLALGSLLFSVAAGLVLAVNTPQGSMTWTLVVSYIVPTMVFFTFCLSDTATNIVKMLSKDANRLIVFEPDLVLKATGMIPMGENEIREDYVDALHGAVEIDNALDDLFTEEAKHA